MSDKILVINSGSSSLKYRLFDLSTDNRVLTAGLIERIGETSPANNGHPVNNHREAMSLLIRQIQSAGHFQAHETPFAIGHRVVHGGESFSEATLINEKVIQTIREAIPLAPLHNPANLLGIEVCREIWPDVPEVAVFDTAFHQTMPPAAYRYAIPEIFYRQHHIRRYGFHGTSFAYVALKAAEYLKRRPEELNLIALHLGNGASAVAIKNGRSIDTSMGMTPMAGLMMGTRCGDLDPGIILHLLEQAKLTASELSAILNRESGLSGIAGSNDMRDVLKRAEANDDNAHLALDMYSHVIKKYIGGYLAILGRVDALIFTGGIGQHAAAVRAAICKGLDHLGFGLDLEKNQEPSGGIAEIQSANSTALILIVPTDEELEIARQTALVAQHGRPVNF